MSTLTLTIQERIKLYLEYKQAYYEGEPLLSDEEFDRFEDELISDGYDPIVGYQEIEQSKKVKHSQKMLSLGKVKVLTDTMPIEIAQEIFNKYGNGEFSIKYDGLAIDLQYTKGILSMISTRGSGTFGQNVYDKLKHLVPEKLSTNDSVSIRCELVMNQRLYETKYTQYKHSRSLVAGITNDINIDDKRKFDLELKVLEAVTNDGIFINPTELHTDFISMYKEFKQCESAQDIKQFFDECHQNRSNFEIGSDGLVYSSQVIGNEFLHNGHHPKHAIAIKFKPPVLESVITDIKWKLHKTGKYSPKLFFKPIIVDGREIKQASGHNIEYLVKHDITIGKTVNIILSNDIIPMIRKAS